MKKKIKIILLIIVIIAVLRIIFFTVDSNRVKNNQKPLFCIKTSTLLDGGTIEYLGIGYKGQIINEVNKVIDKYNVIKNKRHY